jgi:hypothetical protein
MVRQFVVIQGSYLKLRARLVELYLPALQCIAGVLSVVGNAQSQAARYRYLLLSICLDAQLGQLFQKRLRRIIGQKLKRKIKIRLKLKVRRKLVFKLRHGVKYKIKRKKQRQILYKLIRKLRHKLSRKARRRVYSRVRRKVNVRVRYKIKLRLYRKVYKLVRAISVDQLRSQNKDICKSQLCKYSIFSRKISGLQRLKVKLTSQDLETRVVHIEACLVGLLYKLAGNHFRFGNISLCLSQQRFELFQQGKFTHHSAYIVKILRYTRVAKAEYLFQSKNLVTLYKKAYRGVISPLKTRIITFSQNLDWGLCSTRYLSQPRYQQTNLISAVRYQKENRFASFLYLVGFFSSKFRAFSVAVPVTHSTWFKYYLSFFFQDYLNSPSLCLFYSHPFFQRGEQTAGFAALQACKSYKLLSRLSNYQLTYYVYMLLFSKNIRIFVK